MDKINMNTINNGGGDSSDLLVKLKLPGIFYPFLALIIILVIVLFVLLFKVNLANINGPTDKQQIVINDIFIIKSLLLL